MILSYLGLSGKIIDVYGEESIDKRENPFNQVKVENEYKTNTDVRKGENKWTKSQ